MPTNKYTTVLASAARTTTQTVKFTNNECRGLYLIVDTTVVGTGSITPKINIFGDALLTSVALWTAVAAVTTNKVSVYLFMNGAYDGLTAAANPPIPPALTGVTERISLQLPNQFDIVITANNANAATYSVGAYSLV